MKSILILILWQSIKTMTYSDIDIMTIFKDFVSYSNCGIITIYKYPLSYSNSDIMTIYDIFWWWHYIYLLPHKKKFINISEFWRKIQSCILSACQSWSPALWSWSPSFGWFSCCWPQPWTQSLQSLHSVFSPRVERMDGY